MAMKSQAYQAHSLWWNSLRMHCQMLLHAVAWGVSAQLVIFVGALAYLTSFRVMFDAGRTWLAAIITAYIPDPSPILLLPFRDVLAYPDQYAALTHHLWLMMQSLYWWTLPVPALVFCTLLEYFRRQSENQVQPEYVRGAVMKTPRQVNREIAYTGMKADFPIGKIKVRVADENQHCFVIGRPRQGKTQMLNPIIARAKRRSGARGIVFDFKGELWGQFGEPERGDRLFNPFDTRTLGWSILRDCKRVSDLELFANALIPDPPPQLDSYWTEATRNLFISILKYCYLNDKRNNTDIWRCISASGAELKNMFETTPGCEAGLRHLENPDSRQTTCFLNELMVYGRCFSWLPDGDFSVSDWLERGTGWLFVASFADVRDALRPATRLFMEVLIARHMALPEDVDRRIFYFLDEFTALGKLPSIEMALNQGAGKGASLWLFVQAFGQVDAVYGRENRDAIVNGCGISAIFSVADPNTAKLLSDKVGDVEYFEQEIGSSYGVGDNRAGETLRRTKKCEKLLLPVQFMRLKKFECIVILPDFGVTQTRIKYSRVPLHQPACIVKEEFDLEFIASEFKKTLDRATEYRAERERRRQQNDATEHSDNPDLGPDKGIELDIDDY